jgi:hypothetical protein
VVTRRGRVSGLLTLTQPKRKNLLFLISIPVLTITIYDYDFESDALCRIVIRDEK